MPDLIISPSLIGSVRVSKFIMRFVLGKTSIMPAANTKQTRRTYPRSLI